METIEQAKVYIKEQLFRLEYITGKTEEHYPSTWDQLPTLLIARQDDYLHGFPEARTIQYGFSLCEIRAALIDLERAHGVNGIDDSEYIAFVDFIEQHSEYQRITVNAIDFLKTREFHSDLSKEVLAEIVLFIFGKNSYREEDYNTYIAQLQSNPREMIQLLGMGEEEYELLWKEIITPTMLGGDCRYWIVTGPVLTLLRRKRDRAEMTARNGFVTIEQP